MLASVYDTNANGVVDAAETVAWAGVTEKPSTFPPDVHNHDDRYFTETELATAGSGAQVNWANLTGVPVADMTKAVYDTNGDGIIDQAASVPWTGVSGKPTTFAPSAHRHPWVDLTDIPATFAPSAHCAFLGDLTSDVPTAFPPSTHTHANFLYGETPGGTVDGANTVFTTGYSYLSGTVMVTLNGLVLALTEDFTETGESEITLIEAPYIGDDLRVYYQKAV